jgi:hypothetical protein
LSDILIESVQRRRQAKAVDVDCKVQAQGRGTNQGDSWTALRYCASGHRLWRGRHERIECVLFVTEGFLLFLAPRLVIAAVYKELKEEMKFLWTKDLRINTVHVDDVVSALFAIANNKSAIATGSVFNLADKGDTNQETVNAILRSIFGISTGYQGTIISNLARVILIPPNGVG